MFEFFFSSTQRSRAGGKKFCIFVEATDHWSSVVEITSIQVLRILNAQLNEVKFKLKLSHLEYETQRHCADFFSLLIEGIIKLQTSFLPKHDLCSLTLHVDAFSFCYDSFFPPLWLQHWQGLFCIWRTFNPVLHAQIAQMQWLVYVVF